MISMKSYIKRGVIFLFIIQALCGCANNKTNNKLNANDINENIDVDLQASVKKMPYTSYVQKEIELATYEPLQGAYLGAYVLANPEIEFDISQFEEAVDKTMAIGLRHYQIGDPFPDKWLLECVANKKAPHMVILPRATGSPYDKESLEETAKKFENTYGVPVFIEFYPNPKDFRDPTKYMAYFRLAKEIFDQYAPNTVFVWSVDLEDVYDAMLYYPGDDYVDWVGISMYFPIYKNKKKYQANLDERLDYFYNMYKDKKPIMISKLAVSHYSKEDHTFYIDEATAILNQIYIQIPHKYPRIKAINYIDINNIKVAPKSAGSDNFRVSTEPKITAAYKNAIKSPHYLEDIQDTKKEKGMQWVQMKTPVYKWENDLYVLEETILYDWAEAITDEIKDCETIIGGSKYYALDQVAKIMGYKYSLTKDILRIYK